MPGPANNNQQQNGDLEQENQRLRQQVRALQQRNETLTTQFDQRTRKLQATESRLQRLATNLPGVIFQYCLAPDGTQSFPYVSEKSREIYGIEPKHFAQVFELVHPDDSDHLQAAIQQSALTLNRFDCQYRIITPSGTLKWLQALSQPARQDNGDIIWDGIVIDISDRHVTEAQLRQQEAQYRQVFETIIDGLGIVDLEQGQLVEVNPAYHQMHGYSYAEFLALPYTDIVHPNSHELLAQFIADVKEGLIFTCQAQNVHRNGQIIDIEVKGLPFPYQGKTHALVLVRDISEKVRWQRERDRQEQALHSIVEGTAAHTGAEFFRACAKSLAMALEVAYVLIAEIDHSQANKTLANVIAFWMQTDFGETFQYDLSGTPCHNVFEQGAVCRYADSVQTLFPDDAYLAPMGAESYVGIPLVDSQSNVVGLIAVLHTEAMAGASERQASILEIFAARVGAEIERVRADKALREKDRILQLTLQAGKMGCWSWNRLTNEVVWSDGVEEILGLEANSFGGTFEEYLGLIYPDDLDTVQQAISQALATEQEYRIEHRLLLPDGAIQWLRAKGEIWRDEQGEAIGLLGSVFNDTPHKLAEIALVESTEQIQQQAKQEQLLNQIANQIRTSLELDRILEITVREIKRFLGVDRCHFAWHVRDEAEAYWDVIAEECHPDFPSFVGKHPVANFKILSDLLEHQKIVKLDDVTILDDPELQQTLAALGNRSMLVLPVCAESGNFGIIACIQHHALRLWRDEEVEFLEGIVAQVAIAINQADLLAQSQTRAQELEALLVKFQYTQTQLVQSEKMSSLGQMVAGVAHEINNPVGFIHGNLTHAHQYMEDLLGLCVLYQQHYPNPHPQIRDEIEAIDLEFLKADLPHLFQSMKVGTNRIGAIVKSLRTFSRLDEAALKDIDLHEGIDSTLMILQTRLRAQDWRPEIKVIKDYGDLPRVQCYAGQLNQVFMNILSNAIDALEERDRACTNTQRQANQSQICIQTVKKTNQILIRISDNGDGMSEETQFRLFDPFFTTKEVGKGTGLGMAIAHQIITEKHGGTIECRSELGVGTTFTITLAQ
ncbi:MAG: PAS domain-containing protein [Spirulina sp. SIO3F2]|nr:PAS domain-containing protein [Spirulina sp. SIO3F2]